jgi:hypothetical protein
LISTPVNQQILSTPSPPRKIRPQSDLISDVLSSSNILAMYSPTSIKQQTDVTIKTTASIEYHTSMIQSIDIVKRPHLFKQHDNDTSSRFFSSSAVTKTSVFDAISENQNIIPDQEKISPINCNKRFKRLYTNNDTDLLPQLTTQKTMDEFITPTKQNRAVLKRKSANIDKEESPTDNSDKKTVEQDSDDLQVQFISFY